jgi:hypothetical protein
MTKAEIKAEWVKRLRSGTINQTKYYLGLESGSRCCLGVLCDIAVDEGIIEKPIITIGLGKVQAGCLEYSGTRGSLPNEVCNWAGVSKDGDISQMHCSLQYLNDSTNKSFSEIADIIEQYLE